MSARRKKESQERHFKLKLNISEYSIYYRKYMQKEYPSVEILVKKLVQMPFCREYYLKYPLDGLLRGVCKKMLINVYQLIVFAYFLSEVQWRVDHYIYSTLSDVFPNVIHVNEATDPDKLKELSMFLYFSSYSIKQFLNEDMGIYKHQMMKVFPEFEYIQNNWTSSQHTVGQILNPKLLNKFYFEVSSIKNIADYNFCVDKILQISPCYDITSKNEKNKQLLNFGFMDVNGGHDENAQFGSNNPGPDMYFQNHEPSGNEIKMSDIDMNDFKQFDGDI